MLYTLMTTYLKDLILSIGKYGGHSWQETGFKGLMSHKYSGSIVVLPISKSVEPNGEQKQMTSGFQKGNI